MGHTKDFLKGQEVPSTSASGYLQGNLPLAGKYNPSGVKKLLPLMYLYLYLSLSLLSAALFIITGPIWQKVICGLVFVGSLYMIYRMVKRIKIK